MRKFVIFMLTMLCTITVSSQRTGFMDINGATCYYDTLAYRHAGPGTTYMKLHFPSFKYQGDDYKMMLYVIKVDLTNPYVKLHPYLSDDKYYNTDRQDLAYRTMNATGLKPFATMMGGAFVQTNNVPSTRTAYEITGSVTSDSRPLYDEGSSILTFSVDDKASAYVSKTKLNATVTNGTTTLSIGNINHHRDYGDGKNQLSLFCNGVPKSLAADPNTGVDVRLKVDSNDGNILVGQTNKCTVKEILDGCRHTVNAGEAIISCNANLASTLKAFSVGDNVEINITYENDVAKDMNITEQLTAMGGLAVSKGEVMPNSTKNYAQCIIGCSEDGKTAYLVDIEISENSSAPVRCAMFAARNLGMYNGMLLDGGPSAEITVDGSFVTKNSLGSGSRYVPGALAVLSTAPTDNNVASIEIADLSKRVISVGDNISLMLYGYNKYGEMILANAQTSQLVSITCPEGLGTISNGVFTATKTGSGHIVITLKSTSQTINIPVRVKDFEQLVVSPAELFTGEGRPCQLKAYYTNAEGTKEIPSANVEWSTNANMIISSCTSGLIKPNMDGTASVFAKYNDLSATVNVVVENLSDKAHEDRYINYKSDVEGAVEVDQQLPSVPTSFRITIQSEPQSIVSVYYTTNATMANKVSHSQSAVVPDSGIADIDVTLDYDAVNTYPVTVDGIGGTSETELEDYGSPYVVKDLTAYYYRVSPTGINDIRNDNPVKDNRIYNLHGMKVDSSYHGIIIHNGRKFVQ